MYERKENLETPRTLPLSPNLALSLSIVRNCFLVSWWEWGMRETNGNNYQQKSSQLSLKTVISQMNLPAVEYEITPSQACQQLPLEFQEALSRVSLIPLTFDSCLATTLTFIFSSEETRDSSRENLFQSRHRTSFRPSFASPYTLPGRQQESQDREPTVRGCCTLKDSPRRPFMAPPLSAIGGKRQYGTVTPRSQVVSQVWVKELRLQKA